MLACVRADYNILDLALGAQLSISNAHGGREPRVAATKPASHSRTSDRKNLPQQVALAGESRQRVFRRRRDTRPAVSTV